MAASGGHGGGLQGCSVTLPGELCCAARIHTYAIHVLPCLYCHAGQTALLMYDAEEALLYGVWSAQSKVHSLLRLHLHLRHLPAPAPRAALALHRPRCPAALLPKNAHLLPPKCSQMLHVYTAPAWLAASTLQHPPATPAVP